jgi:esterase/lipase/1-acyl-sn-glycerol-3-phosphate acyltransferase
MVEFNPLVFSLSKLAVRAMERVFLTSVTVTGKEHLPQGVLIFAVNHFTRLETIFLPYELYKLTGKAVMSLAYHGFFGGALGTYLDRMGAVSTADPDRDTIIIRSLLMGNHPWMIFPEGSMIKDKKIVERGKFLVYSTTGSKRPPHTGAAVLALRTEFYRQRLHHLRNTDPALLRKQLEVFDLTSAEEVSELETFLVPVNVTYYPLRSRENILRKLAASLIKDIPERVLEELQTEGTMLLSGVDIDVSIGEPVAVRPWLEHRLIRDDILTPRHIMPDDPIPSRPLLRRIASKLTMRLMASIYGLTTINFDHLAAYLLKYYPSNRLTVFDLAQRVYVAAEEVTRLKGLRFHAALREDQSTQFCSRYQHALAEFLAVAEKSKVVKVKGEKLRKKQRKMTKLLTPVAVRRENPYLVILNEVEYLGRLTRRLRRIAWRPRWLVGRALRRKLCRLDQEQFEADYLAYRREGESKPRHIGAPFLLKSLRRKIGVLLVHGYLAAPEEVRPLAEFLHHRGCTVYAVRLRGHGTSPDDLAGRNWEEWRASVERGYLILANTCRNVVLGGFSMGAGLAFLTAAAKLPKVRAVFGINPPARLRKRSAKLVPAVTLWNRLVDGIADSGHRVHFVPNDPENPEINYTRNPLTGLRELIELMDRVADRLKEVAVPSLIIQGSDDPVVHPEGSEELYQKLGASDKELAVFPSARHVMIRGDGSERIFGRVWDFVRERL